MINYFSEPGPVKDLRIESYGATFVLLKWSQPTEPNGELLGYDIGYQSGKISNFSWEIHCNSQGKY